METGRRLGSRIATVLMVSLWCCRPPAANSSAFASSVLIVDAPVYDPPRAERGEPYSFEVDDHVDIDTCVRDGDADTIVDAVDRCPCVPELVNDVDDEDGCPDTGAHGIRLGDGGDRLLKDSEIVFAFGKPGVLPESQGLIEALADVIVRNPFLGVVRIEAHTDDRGAVELDMKLSQARAEVVRDRMAQAGVDPGRLRAVGRGSLEPILCESCDDGGRERSRRVELHLDHPLPVSLLDEVQPPCPRPEPDEPPKTRPVCLEPDRP